MVLSGFLFAILPRLRRFRKTSGPSYISTTTSLTTRPGWPPIQRNCQTQELHARQSQRHPRYLSGR